MGFLEDGDFSNAPTVMEFFKGKSIFITGGSGFMGKVLIEKLLYSCSDLDRIYLLLRSKKGVQPEDRLSQIYSTECFNRLRKEMPDIFHSKVSVVNGDITEIGLGLSDEDRRLLTNEVNIVFHVAASVRFNDPMKYAVKMNLRGTKEVIDLAKEIKNLLVLVHLSTSYSNTNREVLEEVMYPPHADWRDTLAVCENLDEHTVDVLASKYLGELPNTYTFTKQLGEHVMYEQRGQLPIVIMRPSIVISSLAEPMSGWIDNFNGPVGLLIASGKGVMRSIYTDPALVADYVPVDVAIKAIIASAWSRGTKQLEPTDDIPIYNCCSSKIYRVTLGDIIEMGQELSSEYPLNDMLWHVDGNVTKSKTIHYLKVLILHLLPAIVLDCILWALGKKPILIKVQRRIYTANLALHYYITQQWTFDNTNVLKLFNTLKDEDKEKFYIDFYDVDVKKFFRESYFGARKYLLKESDEDLPKARTHARRLYILDRLVKFLFSVYVIWWIINTDSFQYIFDLFYYFISL